MWTVLESKDAKKAIDRLPPQIAESTRSGSPSFGT